MDKSFSVLKHNIITSYVLYILCRFTIDVLHSKIFCYEINS